MSCSFLLRVKMIAVLALVTTTHAIAEDTDWPSLRGADRSGVAPDSGLLKKWPAKGPALLWKTKGAGRGYASVAISGGRLYTLGDGLSTKSDADEYLTCFDQATGKSVWNYKTGPAWKNGKGDWQSSRATPTVDGNRVYVMTPFGELICVNTDGAQQWRVSLKKDFRGKKADSWGYSESVLIDGDKFICTPGGPQNTMVALNKMSGKKIWSTSRSNDRGAGHASPVISNVGGVTVYVQTTGGGALGVRASDGKLMWSYPIDKTTAVIPTPIVRDDLVFFTAGYNRGGALLRQVPDGTGVSVKEIYPINPKLHNKHGGVVRVGDYLYADAGDKGIPMCIEMMTGEIKWKSRGSGKKSASVVAADGHVYFRYTDGTMTLVKADPKAFQEVSRFKIPGSGDRPSWAHPAISKGRLYLREGDAILCYDLTNAS